MKTRELIETLQKMIAEHPESAEAELVIRTMDHVAAVQGRDLFNLDKPMITSGKTLCGLSYDVSTSDGGYVYPSIQGLIYCCGKHESTESGSRVSFDSVKRNPAVCQGCIEEIEKQKLV